MKEVGIVVLGILVGLIIGIVFGAKWVGKQYDKHCDKIEKNADKFADYYMVMLQWVHIKQDKKEICDYFVKNNYKRVALYGMNDIAYAIMKEFKASNVDLAFCIDRNADNLFLEVDAYRPDEDLPDADVCVVALPDLYEEIKSTLGIKLNCPIVSIEDVVWEI